MHKSYADIAKIPKKYKYVSSDDEVPLTSKEDSGKTTDKNFIASKVEFISFDGEIITMRCKRTKEEKTFNTYYKRFHKSDTEIDNLLRETFYSLDDENEIKLFVENLFYIYYNPYTVYAQCSVRGNIVDDKERILSGEFNFKYNYNNMVHMLKKKLSKLERNYGETYDFKELCEISKKIMLIKNELEWISNGTACDFENEIMEDMPFSKLSMLDGL
jgi:hypothetical protein